MKSKCTARHIVIAISLFLLLFFGLQQLLMPKYTTEIYEGRLIAEYYDDEHDNDVIFIGDCEVYENFSPVTLWEDYGITSYIRGGPQQLIWQSYYLLEDTLQYETPDVVVFNVLSMKYGTPQSEPYNRLNLDGMKLSSAKLGAISASMVEGESALSYIFPILRYHDRIAELTADDFTYFWDTPDISYNGYLMQTGVKAASFIPEGDILANYDFDDSAYFYLDKITQLCADNDIELILIKAPTLYPYWYDQWDTQMEEYAQAKGLEYYNFIDEIDEIGLDFSTDTYDGGLHLNVYGAEKMTSYFGEILVETVGLENRQSDTALSALWQEKSDAYYAEKNAAIS